jgi:hypothetical protein
MNYLKLIKVKSWLEEWYKDYPHIVVKHSAISNSLEIHDYRNYESMYIPFYAEGTPIYYEGLRSNRSHKTAYLVYLGY